MNVLSHFLDQGNMALKVCKLSAAYANKQACHSCELQLSILLEVCQMDHDLSLNKKNNNIQFD
jgi:hypothetical protein